MLVSTAPFILLPLLALWIYAERRWGLWTRIGVGLALMIACSVIAHEFAMFLPRYERTFHRSSLRLASELTAKGETQRVQSAVQTYTSIAATGTTYGASMEMWHVLNHGPRQ